MVKQSTDGLNSGFSFSQAGWPNMPNDPSLSIQRLSIDGSITRALTRSETQIASYSIGTLCAHSISKDDNRNAKHVHLVELFYLFFTEEKCI